jgi:hypothetical protein
MELSEFLMKILQISFITFAILAVVLQSASFEGLMMDFIDKRTTIDFAETVLAAPCILDESFRKGRLSEEKLNVLEDFCLEIDGEYFVEINVEIRQDDEGNPVYKTWKIGEDTLQAQSLPFPITLNTGEKILPGEAYVKVKIT